MTVIDSALPHIRQLQPYLPGKPVEELEREFGVCNIIKLASNENPLGCSLQAQKAIEAVGGNIAFYPDANAFYLKQGLAQKLSVQSDQITIGNGSNDLLDLLARTFLDAQSEVIYSQHAFLVYAGITQACGARARVAQAVAGDSVNAYGHDLQAMLDLIRQKTRMIFIANPNNPTGGFLTRSALQSFIEQVPERVVIVIDEAYCEYVDRSDYPNALQWLASYQNLVVTRTFSKIYGLAGLRVGYAISSVEICDLLNRVRQPFNVNALALAAADASLNDEQFVQRSRENNQQGLDQLMHYFTGKDLVYIPSVGNFLTVDFGEKASMVYHRLLRQGIILRPLENYGLGRFLRITVGLKQQHQRLFECLDVLL